MTKLQSQTGVAGRPLHASQAVAAGMSSRLSRLDMIFPSRISCMKAQGAISTVFCTRVLHGPWALCVWTLALSSQACVTRLTQ
mmetsp:Transcript_7875/g.23306  ORF Transcript_7875/g.23306 Transcript_7875/m.23306 type:complete len:83 (+) Transcript_7875:590-838(+)